MSHSTKLFSRAQTVIPGGVNSPVRAFRAVGGEPLFFKRGQGPFLYDVDNKAYIDFVNSWGCLILGHAHPPVIKAVSDAVKQGLGFGAPTEIEVKMAECITRLVPSIEQVRMVNSGTEATQSAIRLARGYTNRAKIVKFEGCYHGHCDSLLAKAGSGLLTFGIPNTPGVLQSFTEQTLVAPFNDLPAIQSLFEQHGQDIAGVIIEPVAGNMNCILPQPNYLPGLRDLCTKHGSLLIFDEVMTGFRVALGGAQSLYQITPDLTCLGKIIGGGLPVGAFGGKKAIMEHLAPSGPVYQAGTLSGNPVTLAAGLATLEILEKNPERYQQLAANTELFTTQLEQLAQEHSIPFHAHHIGSMFGLFFTEEKQVNSFEQVMKSNVDHFKQFFHGMLHEGVFLAPSAFEAGFVSSAHTTDVIEKALDAAKLVFKRWV